MELVRQPIPYKYLLLHEEDEASYEYLLCSSRVANRCLIVPPDACNTKGKYKTCKCMAMSKSFFFSMQVRSAIMGHNGRVVWGAYFQMVFGEQAEILKSP